VVTDECDLEVLIAGFVELSRDAKVVGIFRHLWGVLLAAGNAKDWIWNDPIVA